MLDFLSDKNGILLEIIYITTLIPLIFAPHLFSPTWSARE